MDVRQVKHMTGEWLAQNLTQYPGLCAAHFVGSITTMPDEAYFPAYKDVDMHLVFQAGSPSLENHGPFANVLETDYRGVILEGGYKSLAEYHTPELALANPEIAHHLTVDSILYDPDGWLQRLQAPVRADYARRKWVVARVEYERKGLEQWQELRPVAQAMDSSGSQQIQLLGYHVSFLVALSCVATLQAPSSAYSRMRDILTECNRLDLYEEVISILSLRNIPSDQVEQLLEEGAEAFDLAVQVRRSPNPFQHKLNPHQRRYFVDKCRSLLEAGFIEEAVGWLLAFYLSSATVILVDGPDEVKPVFAARRDRVVRLLGMDTQEALDERYQRILHLDEQFFLLAEELIQSNPGIFD
ncbi:MAG TPA: hypothetical protein VH349_05500 [Ktedonobacterales bacterium]|jgi:hypothetical protein